MKKPRLYGLIGKKLGHSFSEKYFKEKFHKEGLTECDYRLFELEEPEQITSLVKSHPNLQGLNVTVPYKEQLFPYLDELAPTAQKVGAVNVLKLSPKRWVGHNSDYYGFQRSLLNWLPTISNLKALVLGTGGASKAVQAVLRDLGIPFLLISRNQAADVLTYKQLSEGSQTVADNQLIVNTTPLGMSPEIRTFPEIPYEQIGAGHFVYDLVYNPEVTKLMQLASARGAQVKNGLEMLHLQAERSWEIWNS